MGLIVLGISIISSLVITPICCVIITKCLTDLPVFSQQWRREESSELVMMTINFLKVYISIKSQVHHFFICVLYLTTSYNERAKWIQEVLTKSNNIRNWWYTTLYLTFEFIYSNKLKTNRYDVFTRSLITLQVLIFLLSTEMSGYKISCR